MAAGAGSGKTRVLVDRFLRIVQQTKEGLLPAAEQAGVDRILMITFTEKATREMKVRIVDRLERLGYEEERRLLESAYISTIHSFCSRLLQENPFEARVDPQFRVLDEPHARRMLRRAFDEVVAEAYQGAESDIPELVGETQHMRQRGLSAADPFATLAGAVEPILAALRGAGNMQEDVAALWKQGLDNTSARSLAPVRASLESAGGRISDLLEAIRCLNSGLHGAMLAAYDLGKERLQQILHAPPLEAAAALKEVADSAGRARPHGDRSPALQEAARLFLQIKIAAQEAASLFNASASLEERAASQCHRLLGLAVRVWSAYDEAKRRAGVLDNDDLQTEAVRLLRDAPGVRRRYRTKFRHILVDEFQDTNPLQMRLLELLHGAESQEGPIQPNSLFVVGDTQQSIYGFRHAAPELLQEIERKFLRDKTGLRVPLTVNFRSRPEILQVVNHLFSQAWADKSPAFTPLTCGADFEEKQTPCLELLITQGLPMKDYRELEAVSLAARIRAIVESKQIVITSKRSERRGEPVRFGDVAILFRSVRDIGGYEEAFARLRVPYYVLGGGRGYYARREIRDVMNALRVIDTPLDDLALAATLRSPFVGISIDSLYLLRDFAATAESEWRNSSASNVRRESQAEAGSKPPKAPLYYGLHPLLEAGILPQEEQRSLHGLVTILEKLMSQEDGLPVGHLLERLIVSTRYDARMLCRPGGRRRLANV
ncbi:MAG TPA: UvrD-helicase domain-containing protein, partial [Chthonomonadales bacterium]|nr:UvrD-helicase domain-containing protein [Chthonomonadales bacterium]